MERRRRLADLLAVPAGELLADGLDHLPLPRDHLQRLGDVLAHLARCASEPQQAQAVGGSITTRSRGRCSGKVLRAARPRVKPRTLTAWATAFSAASSSSVAAGLELFEGQRQLFDQPRSALGLLAVELTHQLGDAKLLMSNQGVVFCPLGARHRQFGGDLQSLCALGSQRRFQSGNIVGHRGAISIHATE